MKKIRVLIVDDSSFIRSMFQRILAADKEIEVVGTASDPLIARDMIKRLNPDVVTLDIEMPNMDGLSFLEKIMTLRPMPVVMVSSLTQRNAEQTLRALEIGAIDCIGKPSELADISDVSEELISKIKVAAKAKINSIPNKPRTHTKLSCHSYPKGSVIAIGSSTGGVEALKEVVPLLPPNSPPVLITQHMPPGFTQQFAERLNHVSGIRVQEAADKMAVLPGNAYIAPGGYHLELVGTDHGYRCSVHLGDKVSGHRPSVDVMFDSVAKYVGDAAIGVILTGMGKDGATGLLHMKQAGAYTIGQNESTCVVYGMPKAAFMAGALDEQIELQSISYSICNRLENGWQSSTDMKGRCI